MQCVRSVCVIVAVALTVAVSAFAPFDTTTSRMLADAALRGRSLEYATALTRSFGARLSGSTQYQRAAEWTADQFRAAGVTRVSLEPFRMPRAWSRAGESRARIVSPIDRPIAVEALGWTPSPPDAGFEGEVVAGGQELASSPARVTGRIVLVNGSPRRDFDRLLFEAGALALLFPDNDPDNRIAARVRFFGGDISPMPAASIAVASADTVRELLRRGPVRLRLAYRTVVSDGAVNVPNVVAEIPGRDGSGEAVVVGAHLDSWDFSPGAQDNATGVAMVLEAARVIAALGRPPRRTIRFVLWGGEEQGLLGSSAYVRDHERELDRIVALLNTDGGTGRIVGWTTPARDDVMTAVRALARTLLAPLQADAVDNSSQYAFDSDGGAFIREGIPTLDLNVDDRSYEDIHHRRTDTMDRVNARNLAIGAATVAVTAFAIADAEHRLAPRGPKVAER
jgi:carboxypeptidase Q